MDHEKKKNFGPDTKILFKNTQFVNKMKKKFRAFGPKLILPSQNCFQAHKCVKINLVKTHQKTGMVKFF